MSVGDECIPTAIVHICFVAAQGGLRRSCHLHELHGLAPRPLAGRRGMAKLSAKRAAARTRIDHVPGRLAFFGTRLATLTSEGGKCNKKSNPRWTQKLFIPLLVCSHSIFGPDYCYFGSRVLGDRGSTP